MTFLEVEGTRHIYFEHHKGEGRPVVLVHGWGATGRCWDSITPALLAQGHEVVLLDLRACGRSDKDFDDLSIAALGSDVARLCEHLGLDAPVVNGWSLGGAVAAEAAALLGTNAGGLVLTGGASPRYTNTAEWPHGAGVEDVEGVLAAAALDRPTTFRGVASAVCVAPVGQEVENWLWAMFLEMGPRGDESLRDLAHVDQRKLLELLEVPVLLLHGRDDAFVPFTGAEAAAKLCGNAQLVAFDQCGHAPFLERRQQYLEELLPFMGR